MRSKRQLSPRNILECDPGVDTWTIVPSEPSTRKVSGVGWVPSCRWRPSVDLPDPFRVKRKRHRRWEFAITAVRKCAGILQNGWVLVTVGYLHLNPDQMFTPATCPHCSLSGTYKRIRKGVKGKARNCPHSTDSVNIESAHILESMQQTSISNFQWNSRKSNITSILGENRCTYDN